MFEKHLKQLLQKTQDEKELFELASKIPFDDRMHHTATIKDLDLGLIRGYLQQVKSDLFSGPRRWILSSCVEI